ncbi:MAG: prolyl oligopeptidase family serine peptidase [Halobacteriaceae archaeon]
MSDPYGTWSSPLDPGTVAGDSLNFGHLVLEQDTPYWVERRPAEDGRGVVLRGDPDGPTAITPDDHDVRTLVHEYGGGDFTVVDGDVIYARFTDQRLYRVADDSEPTPLTPDPPEERSARYADLEATPTGDRLYCVRERHHGPDASEEPVTELVTLPTTGGDPTVVAAGQDFYSFPRLDPAGEHLAWTTWNHPRMPWDGTTLQVAPVDDDGSLGDVRTLMGGETESVFQPAWSPTGSLYAVSDRTGWWNLYRVPLDGSDPVALRTDAAEYGVPQWVFGLATYGFRPDGHLITMRQSGTTYDLLALDPDGSVTDRYPVPFGALPHTRLRVGASTVLAEVGGPTQPQSVAQWVPGEDPTVHRQASSIEMPTDYVSTPEAITFSTGDEEVAHALFYPPTNPTVTPPSDERPPLVTMVHGGPTSQTLPVYKPEIQFFTTRGFAVVDVNYRGSTGYGRSYRDRLDGEWGVVDVEDCVAAARYLAEEGRVDGTRLAIRGGSAGGFATLAALAFRDTFDAGASYYGVADLRALAEDTHKFESRYLDGLVGTLPGAATVYEERSPVNHAGDIAAPLLVLQGGEDRVVPPAQAEDIVAALADNDVPYAYIEYPTERHGFRSQTAKEHALTSELGFYATVFEFDPDGADRLELTRGAVQKTTVDTED